MLSICYMLSLMERFSVIPVYYLMKFFIEITFILPPHVQHVNYIYLNHFSSLFYCAKHIYAFAMIPLHSFIGNVENKAIVQMNRFLRIMGSSITLMLLKWFDYLENIALKYLSDEELTTIKARLRNFQKAIRVRILISTKKR